MSTPKIVSRPGPKITPNDHYDQDGYPQLVHPLKPIKDYALKDEFTQLDAPVNLLWDEEWDKCKDHIALREGEEVPTVSFPEWTWVDENKEDHHI